MITGAGGTVLLLCVYYRVAVADAARLQAKAKQMQRELASTHPGVTAHLLRRTDVDGASEHTWMETYTLTADADVPAVVEAIEQAAVRLQPLLVSQRHVERFEPVSD